MNEVNSHNESDVEEVISTSAVSKIVNIIIAPSKALEAIKKKPNVLLPMFLVVLIPALYYVIFWDSVEIQMIKLIEESIEMQGVEATQEMMDLSMPFVKFTPLLIVGGILFGGVFSAIYYYVCSKIAKAKMTFKEVISLSFHLLIISSLSWFLNMLLTMLGIEFSMDLPLTSLASLLPSSMAGTFLYGLALPLEVFGIWSLIVAYFGLQIIGKMSKKASMTSVFVYLFGGMLYMGGSLALTNFMNSLFQ